MLTSPSVQGVRLATLEDLHRISIVAAAAFFWSPTFRFQRPRHMDFPADTVASYFVEYEAAIRNPLCVVLVAEDVIDQREAEHVYAALRSAYRTHPQQHRGIVGVCSFTLKPGSGYVGHFQPQSNHARVPTSYTDMPATAAKSPTHPATMRPIRDLKRDQCATALEEYNAITRPAKLEHLAGKMRLCTLAVAPCYWRRGHASKLVSFCTQLADADDAVLGVSATPSGAIVVEKAGFQEHDIIHIKRLPVHEQPTREDFQSAPDVSLWIGVRLPRGASPSSGIVSRSESPMESQ
ncbi:hypothetical protein BKA66DRAFT_16419 [Pyrenochaeta sp. MPI-SDFR-AT-0127]|nr:hypothetical protein BKA66DRAFT_16419 [Pyrenochaeta sp. MPI-SDFR-AT-0127]